MHEQPIPAQNRRFDQKREIIQTPAIISTHPARRAGDAECCRNPIAPIWSSITELTRAAVIVIPVNTPDPILCASINPAIVDAMLIRPPIHAHGLTISIRPLSGNACRTNNCVSSNPPNPVA